MASLITVSIKGAKPELCELARIGLKKCLHCSNTGLQRMVGCLEKVD